MRRGVLVFVFCLFVSNNLPAQDSQSLEVSLENYVSNYEELTNFAPLKLPRSAILNSFTCYLSPLNFYGCYEVLKFYVEMYSMRNLTLEVSSPTQEQAVEDFSGLAIVPLKKENLNYDHSKMILNKQLVTESFKHIRRSLKLNNLIEYAVSRLDKKLENFWIYNAYVIFYSQAVDSHFNILPTQRFKEQSKPGRGEHIGIGVSLVHYQNKLIVRNVEPNSGAEQAQILKGDILLKADGSPIRADFSNLKGEENTYVELEIMRDEQIQKIQVQRLKIEFKNVSHKILEENNKRVLYVRINDFMEENLCSNVMKLIYSEVLSNQKLDGLIFDLRNNPGGRLDETLCIAENLTRGKIFLTQKLSDQGGFREIHFNYQQMNSVLNFPYSKKNPKLRHVNIAVLVNAQSASASEVLSGIIQDLELGSVIGTKTFGKGSAQTYHQFNADYIFSLTTARYHLPSGRSPNLSGITPDIEIFADPLDKQIHEHILREKDLYPLTLPNDNIKSLFSQASHSKLHNCSDVQYSLYSDLDFKTDKQLEVGLKSLTCL